MHLCVAICVRITVGDKAMSFVMTMFKIQSDDLILFLQYQYLGNVFSIILCCIHSLVVCVICSHVP